MFSLVSNQLFIMLIILIVGFICYKVGLVNQEGNKTCSNLLLLVVQPALIINVYQTDYDPVLGRLLFFAFLAAIVSHIIAIICSLILIPKKNNPEFAIERISSIYSNCGFIGIPLVHAAMGSEGVFFLTAYMAIFNLFLWTHGVTVIRRNFSLKALKSGVISPVFISTVLAILLYFLKIRIPAALYDSFEFISGMTTPLAMFIAGFSVAQSDIKKILVKPGVYRASLVKLIIVPFLTLALLALVGLDLRISYAILIAAACPAATAGTMIAMRYDQNYTYASEIFSVSTLLSIPVIPFVVFVAEKIL